MNIISKPVLTLWGFAGSSTTNRIRIALAVKGIPYQMEWVDLSKNECRTEQYRLTKNAMAQIPLLEVSQAGTDDKGTSSILLKQSVAILEYLEEAYPNTKPLLPKDPIQRAQVREVVEIINSFIQPLQNKLIVETVAEMDAKTAALLPKVFHAHAGGTLTSPNDDGSRTNELVWPQRFIHKGFIAIERILTDPSHGQPQGKYCFGDSITLADCALIPQVMGAKKYRVPLDDFPRICEIYNNVVALEAIQEHLKDTLSTVK